MIYRYIDINCQYTLNHPCFITWNSLKHILGFSGGSAGKESACNVGDLALIAVLGRSPGEKNGYPLQYSGLENSIDCLVHGVAKSWTWLSDFHFHFRSTVAPPRHWPCSSHTLMGGSKACGRVWGSERDETPSLHCSQPLQTLIRLWMHLMHLDSGRDGVQQPQLRDGLSPNPLSCSASPGAQWWTVHPTASRNPRLGLKTKKGSITITIVIIITIKVLVNF